MMAGHCLQRMVGVAPNFSNHLSYWIMVYTGNRILKMPIDHYLYVSYIDSSVYGFGILALSLSVPLSLKSNHFPIQFGRQIAIFISDGFEQDVGVFPQAEQRMPLNELR